MYRVATLLLFLILFSCQEDTAKTERSTIQKEEAKVVPNLLYGIDQNQYQVETQKIKRGDTFGKILEDNGIDYPHVFNILEAIKGKVSVRKLTI